MFFLKSFKYPWCKICFDTDNNDDKNRDTNIYELFNVYSVIVD